MSCAPVAAARGVPAAATAHVRLIREAFYGPNSTVVAATMQLTPSSTQTYAAHLVWGSSSLVLTAERFHSQC